MRVRGAVRGEWLVPRAALPGVVLYVHGGGFVSCSAATHRPITAALARLTARTVFSVEYRLAPEHRFPAAVEDVIAAYEWLLAAAGPNQRIALAGDSAGGNLVLGLSVRLRDQRRRAPACVVAFSPWTDLAGTGPSARRDDGRDVVLHYENLAAFATAYLGGARADAPDASPVYADLAGLSRCSCMSDQQKSCSMTHSELMTSVPLAGGTSQLKVYDDVAHGWQMLVPLLPEAIASLTNAASFISSHMSGPGTLSAARDALPPK